MPRAIWSGALSFGLVNVPVKVVTATRAKTVRFHQVHARDAGRVEMRRFCSVEDKEIPYDEIVKGYRLDSDEVVTFTKEELAAVEPEGSDAIAIEDFVRLEEIDPIYFEKPYYLVPQKGAAKAYTLLREAMEESGRLAVARVVMRTKEHLVAVRPLGDILTMNILAWHDEVVDQSTVNEGAAEVKTEPRELEMAERLIDAMTQPFDPTKYRDEHRERVLALIEAKAEGREVVAPPAAPARAPESLVDALAASIDQARERGGEERPPATT